jgi:hypothetical protein
LYTQLHSRIPGRKAKQTSGLITDQEDILTEVEDEEGGNTESNNNSSDEGIIAGINNEGITINNNNNTFDLIKTPKRLTVPSNS